jgi:prepilin-type N-terminal cleavage/methylation domain-containing protein
MRTGMRTHSRGGFTLIELVISAAVGVMILAGAYLCLNAGIASEKMIDPRVDVLQSARVILAMMSADLRAACPLDNNYAFLGEHRTLGEGDADNLDFATHNYTPRREREADYCEVSYFVQKDPRSGLLSLWRRRNPTLAQDPLSGGRREELAQGLKGVRFEYTDGFDWYDTWGQTNSEKSQGLVAQQAVNLAGMPQAVRITLSFPASPPAAKPALENPESAGNTEKLPEPPLVFQTVVGLELVDTGSLTVSGGAASTSANSQNSPNGPPSEEPPGGGPQ